MPLDSSFVRLKQYIIESTGLHYYADKDAELETKVRNRMKRVGVKTTDGYYIYLTDAVRGPSEFDSLASDLTIGETHFYREAKVIEGLKNIIIPDLLLQNRDSRQIRIWSAGCATGEETYTVSIILKRYFPHAATGWDIQIIGTDMNRDFLARAREGIYSDWSFRETPSDIKRDCFTARAGKWQIRPEYRQGVSFQYHNLASHPFPSLLHNLFSFDLILCRNVMIYFDRDLAWNLVRRFKQSLRCRGWMVVGHADHTLEMTKEFQVVSTSGVSLYRKSDGQDPECSESALLFAFAVPPIEVYQAEMQTQPVDPPAVLAEEKPICVPVLVNSDQNQIIADMNVFLRLINQGDFPSALVLCEKLMETNRLDPNVYFFHALIKEHSGDYDLAEESLRKSIYLDRHFVLGHYHLGLFLQNRGELVKARKSFETVIRLLKDYRPGYRFPNADDMSAGQLKELTDFHIEVLERL